MVLHAIGIDRGWDVAQRNDVQVGGHRLFGSEHSRNREPRARITRRIRRRDGGVGPSVVASARSPSSTRCTSRTEAPSASARCVRPDPRWPSQTTHPRSAIGGAGRAPSGPLRRVTSPWKARPRELRSRGRPRGPSSPLCDGPIRRLHRRHRHHIGAQPLPGVSLPQGGLDGCQRSPICSAAPPPPDRPGSEPRYRVALPIAARRAIWSTATSKPSSANNSSSLHQRFAVTAASDAGHRTSDLPKWGASQIQLRRPGRVPTIAAPLHSSSAEPKTYRVSDRAAGHLSPKWQVRLIG